MEAACEHSDLTAGMGAVMERIVQVSPRSRARLIGVVYLLFFLTAIVGAALTPATANDTMAHQASFRWGFALTMISTACYVALAGLFYQLFRHVRRSIALLAALFGVVGCAITAVGSLFQLAPFVVLEGNQYSSVFDVKQLRALAQMLLDLNGQAGYIALVFFGVFNLLIGYLVFRSTFLPRILGVLMALSGLGWLTSLSPPLAHYLLAPIEVIGILAEASLMLWLLVMGVNSQRWTERAVAAGSDVITV
jgi:hypothetical protein